MAKVGDFKFVERPMKIVPVEPQIIDGSYEPDFFGLGLISFTDVSTVENEHFLLNHGY